MCFPSGSDVGFNDVDECQEHDDADGDVHLANLLLALRRFVQPICHAVQHLVQLPLHLLELSLVRRKFGGDEIRARLNVYSEWPAPLNRSQAE